MFSRNTEKGFSVLGIDQESTSNGLSRRVGNPYLSLTQITSQKRYRQSLPKFIPPDVPNRPASFSLASKCPFVYNQLGLDSCTSCVACMALIILNLVPWYPSRMFLYYQERVLQGYPISDSGASEADALNALMTSGVCSDSLWPYLPENCNVQPPPSCSAQASNYKMSKVGVFDLSDPNLIENVKKTLASGIPVMFGLKVYSNFENTTDGNIGMPSGQYLGGHEILIIGYTIDSFTCINSWGSSWGNEGFCTIPVAYLTISGFVYSLACISPNIKYLQLQAAMASFYMAPQPTAAGVQYTLEPYYSAGSTESKSIVLRSNPPDYFKPYSAYLTQAFGKYNPALRHPTDPNSRLPGWIFSNKQEQHVRQLVNQIISGQLAPMAVPVQPASVLQPGSKNQFVMTAPGFQSAIPGTPTMVPISVSDGQINSRMQTISVIKPSVGETLFLSTGGQRYPMIVQSVETTGPYVTGATVKLGDQTSSIKLNSGFTWVVPGYDVPHSIEL